MDNIKYYVCAERSYTGCYIGSWVSVGCPGGVRTGNFHCSTVLAPLGHLNMQWGTNRDETRTKPSTASRQQRMPDDFLKACMFFYACMSLVVDCATLSRVVLTCMLPPASTRDF